MPVFDDGTSRAPGATQRDPLGLHRMLVQLRQSFSGMLWVFDVHQIIGLTPWSLWLSPESKYIHNTRMDEAVRSDVKNMADGTWVVKTWFSALHPRSRMSIMTSSSDSWIQCILHQISCCWPTQISLRVLETMALRSRLGSSSLKGRKSDPRRLSIIRQPRAPVATRWKLENADVQDQQIANRRKTYVTNTCVIWTWTRRELWSSLNMTENIQAQSSSWWCSQWMPLFACQYLPFITSQNYIRKITMKYWTPEGRSSINGDRLTNNVDVPSFRSCVAIEVEISGCTVPYQRMI